MQDIDRATVHAVAKNVGADRHKLAGAAGRGSPAVGEVSKAVARLDQPGGDTLCGLRVGLPDVVADQPKISERVTRPDYANYSAGAGNSSGVPHVASHAATSA